MVVQAGVCLSRFKVSALTANTFINAFFIVLLLSPSVKMQRRFCSSVRVLNKTQDAQVRKLLYVMNLFLMSPGWISVKSKARCVCWELILALVKDRLTLARSANQKNGKFMSRSL